MGRSAQLKSQRRLKPAVVSANAEHKVPADSSKTHLLVICALLSLATLAVYTQTFWHGFIAYDDDQYVYENPMVRAGLSLSGLAWAFTTFFYANWHPLTWASYMLDVQLFGLSSGPQHVVNVALHLASTLLLFGVLARATRAPFRSALVAGLFALHPLHVESVAWISERKDVLSTFFEMVTLALYVRYAENGTPARYAATAVAFGLSLLAKPMAVTFPLVLLLLDYWPLGRLVWPPAAAPLRGLLWEKAPLLGMSAIASVLTFLAQRSSGAVVSLTRFPFPQRLAHAVVAYVAYMGKAVWPANLAVLYPAESVSLAEVLGCALILGSVTCAAVVYAKQRPYLMTGWLWYIGMLVPVSGLVQVGAQSMADRYMYLPLVGLSIAVIWTAGDLIGPRPLLEKAVGCLAVAALVLLALAAFRQAAYWKASKPLFEHTLAVTNGNNIIQNNLGVILSEEGRSTEAIALYREALAVNPDYPEARANLGHELIKSGQFQEAFSNVTDALRLKPSLAVAHADLGLLLVVQGKLEDAKEQLLVSLRAAPDKPETESNLCYVLQHLGNASEAVAHCHEALRQKPDFLDARFNLGTALAAQGERAAAAAEFKQVLAVNPSHEAARDALDRLSPR